MQLIKASWNVPPQVHALATTRSGGVSAGPYAAFNLGDHVDDDPAAVVSNRERLARQLALPSEPIWLQQVHGTEVVMAEQQSGHQPVQADAIVCRTAGLVCVVQTADCLPVLFSDRHGRCIAAAHAGWRGLSQSILEKTVAAMGISPDEVLAWLGPAIGPNAFEVGADVVEAFATFSGDHASAFIQSSETHWLADIYTLARQRLRAAGVSQIAGGEYCTVAEPEVFFSYRRDGVTGRMASLIWKTE